MYKNKSPHHWPQDPHPMVVQVVQLVATLPGPLSQHLGSNNNNNHHNSTNQLNGEEPSHNGKVPYNNPYHPQQPLQEVNVITQTLQVIMPLSRVVVIPKLVLSSTNSALSVFTLKSN
eukprot:PhF_6_TR29416/c0_g1_i1/m.43476